MKFKQVVLCLGTAAGIFSASAQEEVKYSDNLLKNPSFEEGLNHWTVPGWMKAKLIEPQVDSAVIQGGGGGSLRFSGEAGKHAAVTQTVTLSGDEKEYELTAFVKTAKLTGCWTAMMVVECSYTKDGKNQFKQFMATTPWNKPELDWTPLTLKFTPPENTRMVKVWLRMTSPNGNEKPDCLGTVWFDNVSLVKKLIPPPLKSVSLQKKNQVNILPGAPEFKNFGTPGWLKDTVEPLEKGTCLVFKGTAGKKGYVSNTATPPQLEVENYEFTVNVDNQSRVKGWSPSAMIELVNVKEGKTVFSYAHGTLSQDGKSFRIKTPNSPELTQLRVILGTTACPANFTGESGTISFSDPVLSVVCRKNNRIFLEKVTPSLLGGIYKPDEKIQLNLRVFSGAPGNAKVRLEYEVVDFFGKPVVKGESAEELPACEFVQIPVLLKKWDEPGYFVVKCRLVTDKNEVSEKTAAVIVAPYLEKADPYFSMCHFGLPAGYFPASRRLGCGSTTLALYRIQVEKQEGAYDFSGAEKTIRLAKENDMELFGHMPIYGYDFAMDPPWLNVRKKVMSQKGFTEDYYDALRKYYAACIKQVGNRVTTWSYVNEIDLSSHSTPNEEKHYVRGAQLFYDEVKKQNPALPVIGLCVSGVDSMDMFVYGKKLLPRLKDALDGIGPDAHVIPCVYGPGYLPISEEKGKFRETMIELKKLAGPGKLLSIEEKGYQSVSDLPFDHEALKKQAAVMVRGVILAKAFGSIRWVPHYAVHNGVSKTDYGMWRLDNPRPILAAYAAAARLLAFAKNPIEVLPMTGIYGYVFERSGKSVAVLWTIEDFPITTTLSLPGDAVVYDIVGRRTAFDSRITQNPVYIESSLAPDAMADRIRNAKYSMPRLAGEIMFSSDAGFTVALLNKTTVPLQTTLAASPGGTRTVSLPGGKISEVFFPLKNTLRNGDRIAVAAAVGPEKYTFEKTVELTAVKKLSNVKLDGTLNSFKGVEPISMNQARDLLPVDAAANKLWTGVDDLSMKIYLGYDDQYFYIGAEVTDDILTISRSGNSLWAQDAFQISFDPAGDAKSDALSPAGYDSNDWDYAFGEGTKGPEIFCYKAENDNPEFRLKSLPYPVVVKKVSPVVTRYEVAIPWKGLAPLKPVKGSIFGFNLGYFDADGGFPLYSMAFTGGTTNGKNPYLYRKFILSE